MSVNLSKPVSLTKRTVPNTDTLIRSGLPRRAAKIEHVSPTAVARAYRIKAMLAR